MRTNETWYNVQGGLRRGGLTPACDAIAVYIDTGDQLLSCCTMYTLSDETSACDRNGKHSDGGRQARKNARRFDRCTG